MRTYFRFTALSVLGMLGLSVYILADTFFIANFIGPDGLAALNLALPVYGVINGTGLLIGVGGATRYMICRTRRGENADAPFAASLFLAAVTAAVFLTVGCSSPRRSRGCSARLAPYWSRRPFTCGSAVCSRRFLF